MLDEETACTVCGHPLALSIPAAADPQSGASFQILRCDSCGLSQTSPIPTNLHEHYSGEYYGRRHWITAAYCARRRVRIVQKATAGLAGSLLDIGCGDGTFLLAAAKRGYRTVGTEIGEAAQQARAAHVDVRSSLDEVRDMAPFDVVTMWHTLEHFAAPRLVACTAQSLLREGGAFVVAVPNAEGLQARLFRRHWFHLDVPRHVYHFGRQSLSALLELSGFQVERWYHQELEYDMFGWLQSALNVVASPPNTLYQAMTGKSTTVGAAALAAHYAIGSLLAPAAAVATLTGTAVGRGGTLVAVARRPAARAS
jgi:SAM-dependent methyltransferase